MDKVGLPDWVARSEDEYIARARWAANNLDALADLRSGMRERLASRPQIQAERIARCFESAFRGMWRRCCAGLASESFEVSI